MVRLSRIRAQDVARWSLHSFVILLVASILYQKDFSDPGVDQGRVEGLRKLINGAISPSKDAATRFQSYCNFVLELIRLLEVQLSSSSQENAYFNACFFLQYCSFSRFRSF